ncbi:MAG: LLM class flavin-dependent oxidoreductase [Candidatus Caldarchaeum sp.]|nr:LLM class flavin-dependent oxidoreductase [Candidatus Caldarchaeum sp.]
MKFGLTFGPFIKNPYNAVELAIRTDRLGYDAAWVTHDPLWENSWVVSGAIGYATKNIKVGPAIVNPYSSSLVEIAMGAFTLNNLTNGRAVLGFGPGSKKMLEEAGFSHVELLTTMDKAVEYLKKALNPSTSNLRIKSVSRIPLFIGCQSPKLLQRVGKWQVGALILLTPPSYGVEALKHVWEGAQKAKTQPDLENIVASVLCSVSKDEQLARKAFASFIMHILDYLSTSQLDFNGLTRSEILSLKDKYSQEGWEGLPEKVYELGAIGVEGLMKTLETLRGAGYRQVKIGSPLGHDIHESVSLIASHILPHFKDDGR